MSKTRVYFEDHGQDFLFWDIDNNTGEVVDCQPFQAFHWTGRIVANVSTLAVGAYVALKRLKGEADLVIKYPIEKVETI